jgi:dTDP-4-dehydrorhamnose 3,5-epimerase
MKAVPAAIPDVLILEPEVYGDDRGFLFESYNRHALAEIGITTEFVLDAHSRSARHVLRGLHYQIRRPQGKLVRVVAGEIFDVAVDLRRRSPTFGKWAAVNLSADNKRMLWIPPGFAHGFLVFSEYAECLYKMTDYHDPRYERSILWNDPDLAIAWPLREAPILSVKDGMGKAWRDAEVFTE